MILIFTTELLKCAKLALQIKVFIIMENVKHVVKVTLPLISSTELLVNVKNAIPGINIMIYQEKDAQTVLVTNFGTVLIVLVKVKQTGTTIPKCVKVQQEYLMTTNQREFLKLFLKLKLS
jgi:hypothetical protein